MKKIIILILGVFLCISSFAQNQQVLGKIIDQVTNSPLSGAKIEINGTNIATTNDEGNFTIDCNGNLTLVVSFIGYQTTTLKVNNCNEMLNIALVPSLSELDEVQVAGTYKKQVLLLPRAEIKLETKELKRGMGVFLDDAINANVPGVTMNRRAVSSGQQFNIRGYGNGVGFRGATNNFDGQGYKVYLNNIPITDAEGITLMDDIDFGTMGSVDVIKGPAGSVYGLAIAGVVNMHTIRPNEGETSLQQNVLVGNYGLARYTTQFQMGKEKSSMLLNYSHQTSDGFMAHSASTKDYFNAVLDFKPNDKQYISTYVGFTNSYDQRGGELTIEQYESKDYSGNPNYIKNNAHSEVISFRAGVSHTYTFNEWLNNTTTIFGTGISSNASSAGGWTDKDPINYGKRSTFGFDVKLSESVNLKGIAGFEFQEQRANISGYRMVEDPSNPDGYNIIGAPKSHQFALSNNSTLFTEWTLNLPEDFSVTAGLSTSAMRIKLENKLFDPNNSNPRIVNADYTGLVSPHVAINKVFNNNVSVYTSYSKGYKAPVSGNIVLATSGTLNTGLKPEVGNQFEIGSKGNLLNNKLHYQVALFQAKFKDKFTSVAVPLDVNTTAYTYIANGGSQDNKGVEALLKYTAFESNDGFFTNISPYINTTYSHFKYKDFKYQSLDSNGNAITVEYSGNDVAGVAPWVVNAGLDVTTHSGCYGSVNYNFRDKVPFTSDELHYAEAYNVLNAKLGFRTSIDHFSLDVYAGIDNMLETQYYYMVFLNQLEDAYLPAPLKAAVYGGINLKYNF